MNSHWLEDLVNSLDAVDNIWLPMAIFGTVVWFVVAVFIIKRAMQQANLPEEERSPHGPGFYLMQSVFAFGWVFPLYIVFFVWQLFLD